MIQARKPLIRSACLITAAAASMVTLSVGVAQEHDLRLAAAVGQHAPPPVLNPRHPETYVVQKGDTLWDIAREHKVDPLALMKDNGLSRHSRIKPGDVIEIRAAKN